jgi:hypothetical protein
MGNESYEPITVNPVNMVDKYLDESDWRVDVSLALGKLGELLETL